jgi:hypothetical protein
MDGQNITTAREERMAAKVTRTARRIVEDLECDHDGHIWAMTTEWELVRDQIDAYLKALDEYRGGAVPVL